MNRRPRVLLIAEACNPEWVSVPLEGWSSSQALAQVADTHIVTHVRNRPALERAALTEGREFTAIDSDRVAAPLYWLASKLRGGRGRGWTTVTAFQTLAYYYFERLIWKRFGHAITEGAFDLVHRLTPLSPTAASSLARKCARVKVPFVLGPLNGGLPWPREFSRARRREREWLSWIRGAYRWLPGYRATRRHAACIVVGSTATRQDVPAAFHDKCVYIPENGLAPERFTTTERAKPTLPLRVAFVGRLVDYKNPDVVIEAIAPLARAGKMTLEIIGDGPLRCALAKQIAALGLEQQVTLRGWVAHEQLAGELKQADLFAFPSIREFGGAVVLEAMAMGAVPIVVDYGGPCELISDASGFRLPLAGRDKLVTSLRQVLTEAAAHPEMLVPMRAAGLERVSRFFTWQAKAEQLLQVYRWVLAERDTKPDFGMPLGRLLVAPDSTIDEHESIACAP